MENEEPKPLAYIPETVLKKRKNNEEWVIRKRGRLDAQKNQRKQDQRLIFKRPEKLIQDYRAKEVDFIQMKRRGKTRKRSQVKPPDFSLLFAIRIGRTSDMHPKTKKILRLLRLRQIFSGVFLEANDVIIDMLNRVEPFVTYGHPNLKSVKELIYKKGFGYLDKERIPLTDNNIIEQALGQHGIICLEDIVHEIATVGPRFKEVSSFLWPFNLNKPGRDVLKRRKSYKDGGDAGNREDHINELINKMN